MIFGEDQNPTNPGQPQQQQVRLDASRMETIYANFFALAGAPEEVTIYLGATSPMPGAPQPVVQMSHRLLMQPANAKRLMMALQQTIKAHEDRFGPIEIAPPQRPQGG
ncbi:MAG: DUF3467 domain-containing protein [Phycisphaerales bacterium]|nr:DUF3467 domain-containing protein [Phycisphaerales bacterium]